MPPRGFRPVPPRYPPTPPERVPRLHDPVLVRGVFVKYRDRDSGQYVSKGLFDSLPKRLQEGIKREVHVRTRKGELGERAKSLERYLLGAMRRGLTWDEIGDQYRRDAIRLSLV